MHCARSSAIDYSPHGGHQLETPTGDVVQTGILESDTG